MFPGFFLADASEMLETIQATKDNVEDLIIRLPKLVHIDEKQENDVIFVVLSIRTIL